METWFVESLPAQGRVNCSSRPHTLPVARTRWLRRVGGCGSVRTQSSGANWCPVESIW